MTRERRHQQRRQGRITVLDQRPASVDAVVAVPAPTVIVAEPAPERRRLEPASEDQAMYTCSCGYVFEAPVSTSVGCPHCGDAQAW